MPTVKPQDLKSDKYIELQPDRMSSKIQLIIALDISGRNGNQIAEAVDLSPNRVSIIRNSPMYIQERQRQWEALKAQVLEKKTDQIVSGDPVENRIKDLALQAVEVHASVMASGKSELARASSANSILDRAGYKAKTDRTIVSVEVTEKMADRFERVLGRAVEGSVTKVTTVTKES